MVKRRQSSSEPSEVDGKRKKSKHSLPSRQSKRSIPARKVESVKREADSGNSVDEKGIVAVPDSTQTPKSPSNKKPKYDYSIAAASPFPKWPAPTLDQVTSVFKLLEDKHGKIEMSQDKPSLGLRIEGCNDEEPALIDAVIRARLSAGTNDLNASRAFMGILNTFGRRRKIGEELGIVDWEAVRVAPLEQLYEAIKIGGMGNVKSKSCKAILDMVYKENLVRQEKGELGRDAKGIGLLTLEYMRDMSKDEAFEKFTTFPGVGPKTAACIISICMQHSSFAVDTHVYRICTWLGWVPPGTDRDGMFAHLDKKIPDHLKFDLHYLMIRHGRFCGRCRANTSSTGKDWESVDCPIEHLVSRTGKRKL